MGICHTVSDQVPGVRHLHNGRLDRQYAGVQGGVKTRVLEVGQYQGKEGGSVQYIQRESPLHHTGTTGPGRRGGKRQESLLTTTVRRRP